MRLASSCFLFLLLQCSAGVVEKSRQLAPAETTPDDVGSTGQEGARRRRSKEQPAVLVSKANTERTLSSTVAWILFGGVTLAISVFYLVNYTDKDIIDATWLLLSNAVSLFCAVLVFLSFRDLIALVTGGADIQERRLGSSEGGWDQCWSGGFDRRRLAEVVFSRRLAAPPSQKTLTVDILCVVIMFFSWELALFAIRKRGYLLSGLGLIAAHCTGFSSLYAFGNLQQCQPFRNDPGLSLLVALMGLVLLGGFFHICHVLRKRLALLAHEDNAHSVHNWGHQCAHTEREALSFAVSFLLAQTFQHSALESLAPLHDVPKGKSTKDGIMELCYVAALTVSVIGAGFGEHHIASHHGHHDLEHDEGHGHEMTKYQVAAHMVKDTLAFTIGWLFLALIKLVFWSATDDKGVLGGGNIMTSHLVLVFLTSLVSFVLFFIIDAIADRSNGSFSRGLRALGKSLMLCLGLAWEGAFWEGAHSMSVGMGFDMRESRMLATIFFSVVFTAFVMPAYILFIVPHTMVMSSNGTIHVVDYGDHEEAAEEAAHAHSAHDHVEAKSPAAAESGQYQVEASSPTAVQGSQERNIVTTIGRVGEEHATEAPEASRSSPMGRVGEEHAPEAPEAPRSDMPDRCVVEL